MKTTDRSGWTIQTFGSFEEAEAHNRMEWMERPKPDRMRLLEMLRKQIYPNDPGHPQGLQRVLTIVD
jgi:hypothetical protein